MVAMSSLGSAAIEAALDFLFARRAALDFLLFAMLDVY